MNSSRKSSNQPIAGDAFADTPHHSERDPYERLAELMQVIQELCPQWPQRETFAAHRVFLL